MSSKQWEFCLFFSQFGFLLFLFLLCLLWPKLQSLCWITVVRVGTSFLFLTLGDMLSVFTIEDNVCCAFVIYRFYYVEVCSLYSCFLESFCHKWMLNFVKGFLYIYWDNHILFIVQFVNVVYHIDWFANIEESLHPYTLTMRLQKEKFRKQFHSPLQWKE